jgi:hypothetical protein
MSLPPPNLPAPNLPPPNLPPPAPLAEERVISKFEQAPPTSTQAATVAKQLEEVIPDRPIQSGGDLFAEARRYVFGSGKVFSILAVISLLMAIGSALPLAGLPVAIVCAVYLGSYFYRIIHHTLAGDEVLPAWPKLNEPLEDLLRPGVRIASAQLFSHALVLLAYLNAHPIKGVNLPFLFIGMLVACAYFPPAAMMIVFQERFGAIWPHIVIPAFRRTLPAMQWAVGLCIASSFAGYLLSHIPVLGQFISSFVGFGISLIVARMLGMIAAQHRKALVELH